MTFPCIKHAKRFKCEAKARLPSPGFNQFTNSVNCFGSFEQIHSIQLACTGFYQGCPKVHPNKDDNIHKSEALKR